MLLQSPSLPTNRAQFYCNYGNASSPRKKSNERTRLQLPSFFLSVMGLGGRFPGISCRPCIGGHRCWLSRQPSSSSTRLEGRDPPPRTKRADFLSWGLGEGSPGYPAAPVLGAIVAGCQDSPLLLLRGLRGETPPPRARSEPSLSFFFSLSLSLSLSLSAAEQ